MPGWAWMILGVALTIVVVLAAPRLLKGDGGDGFFRPRPNPDARPIANGDDDDAVVPEDAATAPADPRAPPAPAAAGTQYDFYTLLPGDEVAISDAELAASARAEEARARADRAAATPEEPATPAADATPVNRDAATVADAAPTGDDARYILQAGAFSAADDAEALKARIALLGLGARVEAAEIGGKTMYRVRMGPYATASDLAEAKQKLGNGGLPALAIKAR